MTKIIYADWHILRQAEEKGLVVSMDRIIERERTELNKELATYFYTKIPQYNSSFSEDQCEDVLYCINNYIEDNNIDKYEIDFPHNGTEIYLLKITDNLQVKITVADEYHGSGDYSKYIEIDRFVITPEATKEDVDALIEFLDEIKY